MTERGARPAILLDRDGTIIVERSYLSDPAGVELEVAAAQGLRTLSEAGWPLVVITNQSGVARGFFDRAVVDAVNARLAELLAEEGVEIDGWYVCPHEPRDHCECRKPRPGLAIQAATDLNLDLKRSWMIGDKNSDLELAKAIGGRGVLVRSGYVDSAERSVVERTNHLVVANLEEGARLIVADRACTARDS